MAQMCRQSEHRCTCRQKCQLPSVAAAADADADAPLSHLIDSRAARQSLGRQ